ERRVIKELKGSYQGPKNVKASGKAAGTKKKKTDKDGKGAKKTAAKKPAKPAAKRKPAAPSGWVSADGLAPLESRTTEGYGRPSLSPGPPPLAGEGPGERGESAHAQTKKGPLSRPLFHLSGRHNWTRTNDPHHVKVVL